VNGSGKSRFALGLAEHLRARGVRAGVAFQDPDNQIVGQTVLDDCAFALENAGMPRNQMLPRVRECLAQVGLDGLEARSVSTLSGGQKQRLAVAGLLAMDAQVLVFDEVTAMMDAPARRAHAQLLRKLTAQGRCVLSCTQIMDEALCAQRVGVMCGGQLVGVYTPDELAKRPEILEQAGLQEPACVRGWRALCADSQVTPSASQIPAAISAAPLGFDSGTAERREFTPTDPSGPLPTPLSAAEFEEAVWRLYAAG
jgi:energy-coupling factor transporter ATP-binding protein EcfA2